MITAAGNATSAGLRRALDVDVVQRLLDRSQGGTRYSGTLTAQGGGLILLVESDLSGLAIDGVTPIRKTAAEALPFDSSATAAETAA